MVEAMQMVVPPTGPNPLSTPQSATLRQEPNCFAATAEPPQDRIGPYPRIRRSAVSIGRPPICGKEGLSVSAPEFHAA